MENLCTNHPNYVAVSAKGQEIYLPANQALELAFQKSRKEQDYLFGSQVERLRQGNFIAMPRGSKDQRFTRDFLHAFWGISNQLAPDIIDFRDRVFYEFKTERFAKKGAGQLGMYYKLANEITRGLGEPPWKQEYAMWTPPETLYLGGHHDHMVCTHSTNYSASRGLVLYCVWKKA